MFWASVARPEHPTPRFIEKYLFFCIQRMMSVKRKVQSLAILIALVSLGLQSCSLSNASRLGLGTSTPEDIPTWTPRPQDLTLTALPTATEPAPVLAARSANPTPTGTELPTIVPTSSEVTFSVKGGNLSVRRGPSVDYNFIGALYDGETTVATGRDRISRWLLVEIPTKPGVEGWVTTETVYSTVHGDVSNLPFVSAEPAAPAYIRNCTDHELLIMPDEVTLLTPADDPYNEERFSPGIYKVYDQEDPKSSVLEEVDLSEGETHDVRVDWAGEKSKCPP